MYPPMTPQDMTGIIQMTSKDKAELELAKGELQEKMKELEESRKPKNRTMLLDKEDRLLLENIALREELSRLKIQEEKSDAQMMIFQKYGVNSAIEKISVNLETGELTITS